MAPNSPRFCWCQHFFVAGSAKSEEFSADGKMFKKTNNDDEHLQVS